MEVLAILEVAIGIVLIYLILSLVCTSLLEAVIGASGLKHKTLRKAVERLVGDSGLADQIYQDPEIVALCGPKGREPSYIPTDVFARTILNLATNNEWRKSGGLPSVLREKFVELATGNGDDGDARQASEKCARRQLGAKLVDFMDEANGDIAALQNKIELWFDRTGDRSKGWFKRVVNLWLILLGLVVAAFLNADTIMIFKRLSDDPALRAAAVELAEERIKGGTVPINADSENGAVLQTIRNQVGGVAPFIGWSRQDPLVSAWRNDTGGDALLAGFLKLVGLIFTAFAISLGAPFWFDLLQKLVNVRKSVAAAKATEISKTTETSKEGGGEPKAETAGGETVPAIVEKEPAYTGPMAGFSPTAAKLNLGNAYWLARAADLAYETDNNKVRSTIASWGMAGYVFESQNPNVTVFWKGKLATVDTQGFIAADDNAVLVCFRGTEPTRPADVVTNLQAKLVAAGEYGAGKVHEGFKSAIDAVWKDVADKIAEQGDKKQPVWFTGHSLGGALAVLAASRYERFVKDENAKAKKAIAAADLGLEKQPEDAQLIGKRQQALARLRGRVAGAYTIGQPRVGNEDFVKDFDRRMGEGHVRIINNRDLVPRVPLRAMDYEHSGTVLYFDEFGRLHRDPGLWLRLLDTVFISKAEVEKAREGVADHSADAYVDLLDKARKSTSALTRLALT